MGDALSRLSEEDPTFRVHSDEETGQTIIEGMGELHLEVIVSRLLREFKVDANVGRPQVAYRETIKRNVSDVDMKFKRQTGGSGMYAHVTINLERQEPGGGFVFEDKTKGGSVPKEYISAVEKGIRDALEGGQLAGYPIVDVKATLTDGSSPHRRLERDGVPYRRIHGAPGGCPQIRRQDSRTGHGRRGSHP